MSYGSEFGTERGRMSSERADSEQATLLLVCTRFELLFLHSVLEFELQSIALEQDPTRTPETLLINPGLHASIKQEC